MSDAVYIPVKVETYETHNGYWVAKIEGITFVVGDTRELAIEDLRRKLREEGRTE